MSLIDWPIHRAIFGLAAALSCAAPSNAEGGQPGGNPDGLPIGAVPGQLVVQLSPDGDIDDINLEFDTAELGAIADHNVFLLELPPQVSEQGLLQILSTSQQVEWVDFNISVGLSGGNTQSFFLSADVQDFLMQQALDMIGIDEAQQLVSGAPPITVAVLDTGIDAEHVVLAGRVVDGGYNFIDQDDDVSESGVGGTASDSDTLTGHGTFVAGLIAHIAPHAQILPIKVLDESGEGDAFHAAAGILHAIEHGASIVNLSLGTTVETQILNYALEQAELAGVTVIAAAGNLNQSEPAQYPAAHEFAFAVTATNSDDLKASFSDYGLYIALAAPGVDIVSTFPGGGYASTSGTSASTAIVTAAAAMVRSVLPNADTELVRSLLMDGALDVDGLNPEFVGLLGAGRLRMDESVATASSTPAQGDLNLDGVVNLSDLLILLSQWGPCADCDAGGGESCSADLDGDCTVSLTDLLLLLSNWG